MKKTGDYSHLFCSAPSVYFHGPYGSIPSASSGFYGYGDRAYGVCLGSANPDNGKFLICGRKFYIVGAKALIKGNPNMDSLVAIGTGSAFIYSLVMTIGIFKNPMNAHHLYYESAAVVVTLVMLGKHMESRSKGKTSEAIRKLMELAPDTASV